MPAVIDDLVADIPLLTSEEAARVASDVVALRSAWRMRHEPDPFYTLGTASYMDARDGQFAAYQAQACATNNILRRQFSWVLERLRQAVACHVGGDVSYDPRLALPGFHVFLFDPACPPPVTRRHYDVQYDLVDWSAHGSPDVASQLSLTLPVSLPACGGGLLLWNIDRRELARKTADEKRAYAMANRSAARKAYTVGRLAVHSGHLLHQIAPAPVLQAGDSRITLQAHAVPIDGRWTIYW